MATPEKKKGVAMTRAISVKTMAVEAERTMAGARVTWAHNERLMLTAKAAAELARSAESVSAVKRSPRT